MLGFPGTRVDGAGQLTWRRPVPVSTAVLISAHGPTYAETGRETLAPLYNSMDCENRERNTNWLSATETDDWLDAATYGDKHVTELGIESPNLSGKIEIEPLINGL